MEKIRIITDSAADLGNIRPEVTVIPMKISFVPRPIWTA